MVTVGAQEAMAVLLTGLFDPNHDVLLVSDPTYIGITGLARILGIRVVPVSSGDNGLEPEKVERAIRDCSQWGHPRALYDIPDFNNPLGTSMPLSHRHQILDICAHGGVFFIEDNPYGMFAYDGERMPTLKALDRDGTVLYIGSFAKTLFPGLRLGYLVADQKSEANQTLAQEFSRVKSLLTVNSSPLLQAAVGAVLLRHQCSLQPLVTPKLNDYRRNRDVMFECLKSEFAGMEDLVKWNRPNGGFFLTMNLPFPFGREELQACSSEYGVIVCPMRFFSLMPGRESQIRLSFSYVDEKIFALGFGGWHLSFVTVWPLVPLVNYRARLDHGCMLILPPSADARVAGNEEKARSMPTAARNSMSPAPFEILHPKCGEFTMSLQRGVS